ncbi:F-box protein CPR1-like [Bidens hawaiensis]|uniref:F-box protein CPR1-like n=1 Tax=Bidens hawaiensis TaxID=980011 RepID=UPI004049F1EB
MAELVNEDVVEQILIAMDANDLIRYKSVCKTWYSLITSPRFVTCHLNHSYNKDYSNKKLGHRRVRFLYCGYTNLLGSSNGLVCMEYFRAKLIIVGNPLTREVRQLTYPSYTGRELICWGFGYDSARDDYKVIVGAWLGKNQQWPCFRLLSLKSNAWRDVGEEKYRFTRNKDGVLFNGALHWIVWDQNNNYLILSFDLSKEEFKEIHLPDDVYAIYIKLGIMNERLCAYVGSFDDGIWLWLMKKYNVKESWELLKMLPDDEMNYDIVHTLRLGPPKDNCALWVSHASKHPESEHTSELVFVQSLVSPYYNAR